MKRWQISAGLAAGMAVALVGFAAPANAAPTARTVVWHETVPMTHGGWDSAVAEAHGFKIETVNGQTTSVPVTDAAKALAAGWAAKKSSLLAHPDATVRGNCGTSSVDGRLINTSTGYLTVFTSYTVYAPSTEQSWFVNETGIHGGLIHTFNFSGLNASTRWAASPQTYTSTAANQGGDVEVTPGSYAILIDGDVCFSGSPVDIF